MVLKNIEMLLLRSNTYGASFLSKDKLSGSVPITGASRSPIQTGRQGSMLRRSLLRRVCPDGRHDMLLPESAVRPVWPYGAICPVEVSRLASACRAFSLSGLHRVGVGADGHGVCGHPHGCHHGLAWGHSLGGRYEYPGHRAVVERRQRHRESLVARLG